MSIHLPEALHALAAHLTNHPALVQPATVSVGTHHLAVQLHGGELHDLVRWAATLGTDQARVARGGDPDDDGVVRTGWTHLRVHAQLAAAAVPVEVWCAVPQLDAGDLANGSTVTDLGALLQPLAAVA